MTGICIVNLQSKRKQAECDLKLLQNRILLLQVSNSLYALIFPGLSSMHS